MVKRVCGVLEKIDYINVYRRTVIDSLITFQIENFVKSKNGLEKLNEGVDMQVPVGELFFQVEREARYDEGYDVGFDEGKDEIILKMLAGSVSPKVIQEYSGCSIGHIIELKNNHFASK